MAALIGSIAVLAWKLSRERLYASEATFSVQATDQRSPFSGIAAQFGLALPTQQGEQSPAYYMELAKSRPILENVCRIPIPSRGRQITVSEALDVDVKDSLQRLDETVQRLSGAIATSRSRETGIVTVHLSARAPDIAQGILRNVILQLNDFNLQARQSRAATERRFIEQRLATTRLELEEAESRLENFLQRNRAYQSSPELSFQYDRLDREVRLRQQLYVGLAQNFEQARIDEVRVTPALTIIAPPSYPIRPQARGTLTSFLIAVAVIALLGALLSSVTILFSPHIRSLADDLAEYDRHREALKLELRRPWRLLGFRVA
jgi:uncharacterized protein involved in exopolysaccharide biosynthesis